MKRISENIRKFNLFEILVISLFWLLLFASPLLRGRTGGGFDWNNVIKIWKEHAVLLALFLINRVVLLPFLFFRHKRALYIITATLLISLAAVGMYFYDKKPDTKNPGRSPENYISENRRDRNTEQNPLPGQQRRGPGNSGQPEPVPAYINLLILSVLVFGFDTGLKTASKWVYAEQQRIILEKENVETQLAFLKHQISPHFFMNTLNNIHSLIDIDTSEAKKSVIKLSSLMRHLLYESANEFSPVKSEIDFIKSYVDLMKLRYPKEIKITLNTPKILPDKSIPPLIVISLLENAFKHGISYTHESFVEINISITNERMHFKITNGKNKEAQRSSEAGIGIENTRKRLELLFRENYTLDLTDRGNVFITDLIIPI